MHDDQMRHPVPLAWQLFILLTSMTVLVILAVSIMAPLPSAIKDVLNIADDAICAIFLVDFAILFYLHKDRKKYMLTWGWLDLISSIPLVDPFRWGRLARVIRLLRLFRGLRGSAGLWRRLFLNKRETAGVAIILIFTTVALFSSVAILIAEEGSSSNIKTAEDAIWWTFTTMTTVGYGDLAPVTTLGRAVAVLTMFAGIGIFGAFTALVASYLVTPEVEEISVAELTKEIRSLSEKISLLQEQFRNRQADVQPSYESPPAP